MKQTMIDDSWIREIYRDGRKEYTFCGALEDRYKHIAFHWNSDTRKKHGREFNNIILPALKDHNNKTIREYTREDYEEAIANIKNQGYMINGVRHEYAESSIRNFENLIYYVVHHSSVYGLCDNVLWGTQFVLDVADETEEIESRVLLKKSLSVEQERAFFNEVVYDPKEDGAVVALLLMWGLGLRNAEACGLNYGDIKLLEGHSECHVAWIYKTTKIKSDQLQSGGKTYNTGRIVPVPYKIVAFLTERKDTLREIINEHNVGENNIDELPICCDGWLDAGGDGYKKRCRADRVSVVAHDIFEKSGISSKQVAYLDAELSEGNTAEVLKEKEPTAYLLRRNFATQMSILGLSNSEMQYLLGHDVEDAYESRNEYVDNERIYSMHKKLEQRELLNPLNDKYNKAEICIHRAETVKLHISAKEPTDGINVDIKSYCATPLLETKWYEEAAEIQYDRTVNNLQCYHSQYNQ